MVASQSRVECWFDSLNRVQDSWQVQVYECELEQFAAEYVSKMAQSKRNYGSSGSSKEPYLDACAEDIPRLPAHVRGFAAAVIAQAALAL